MVWGVSFGILLHCHGGIKPGFLQKLTLLLETCSMLLKYSTLKILLKSHQLFGTIYTGRSFSAWGCYTKRRVSILTFKGQVCYLPLLSFLFFWHVYLFPSIFLLFMHERIEDVSGEAAAGRSPSLASGNIGIYLRVWIYLLSFSIINLMWELFV